MQKQIGQQISERVKKIREIKKYGKKVQVEVEQQKQKDKREMLEQIKKFRKVRKASIINVNLNDKEMRVIKFTKRYKFQENIPHCKY